MMGILIITTTAFLLALFIMFISERFKSENEEEQFVKLLPGYNCGVCGYGTCQGLAKEMIKNSIFYQKCKPLRGDALKKMETYLRGKNLL